MNGTFERGTWLIRVALPSAILVLALVLATILRLHAITVRYGYVSAPTWLRTMQYRSKQVVDTFHPRAAEWQPEPEYPHQDDRPSHYRSDPYTYLLRAREMDSFYGAHYREPVFPFAVKGYLRLLHDEDVAVSFASASFSLLCVLMAYIMGAMAFSRWVGCVAAMGMAIEREVIFWGVSGWRDDAFTFVVVLSACAMLDYRRAPSAGRGVFLGAAAGLACLTRIFSATFLAAGFFYLLCWSPGSWRHHLRHLAIATLTAGLLIAPYLVNCWRVFGDPLYALNYQPIAYLEWEHADPSLKPGAVGYIGGKLLKAPFQTLDAAAIGMTSYPFSNKWNGFAVWLPGLDRWLARAALIGLVLFTGSASGRLLLIVLLSAQVPFAFTWQLSSDWRYTEFTYPFFIAATGLAMTTLVAAMRPSWWTRLAAHPPSKRSLAGMGLILGAVAAITWLILRTLPVLTFRETLISKGVAVIMAGPRDASFFKDGWSDPFQDGNVTARLARAERAVIDVPLPQDVDYSMTVRLDPFPPPAAQDAVLPSLRILFNGTLLRDVVLAWNPEKVGSYELAVARAAVRPAANQLTFVFDPAEPGDGRRPARSIRFWYVLVRVVPRQ